MTPSEEKILAVLADHGSLSGVEIMSMTDIPDDQVSAIIRNLAEQKLVTVSGAESIEDQAVTIQTKGLAIASRALAS